MMKLKKNLPKILPNFSSCLEPAHPSVKIWSPFALVSVSVLPKSFGLSCFLDIFPGKVVQPGPPIIYPWDVSRSCARRLCPQTNYSNTAKHAAIQNISWLKKNSRSKRRTPEYPVVQYCGVTTSIFLFPCLERAIKDTSWMSCWWVRKQATKKYAIRANVRISFFLSERRVPVLRSTH